jgi:hypothetical protein
MRRVLDDHAAVMIGELYLPMERLAAYYSSGVHLPFNFHLLSTPLKRPRSCISRRELRGGPPAGRLAQLGTR